MREGTDLARVCLTFNQTQLGIIRAALAARVQEIVCEHAEVLEAGADRCTSTDAYMARSLALSQQLADIAQIDKICVEFFVSPPRLRKQAVNQ